MLGDRRYAVLAFVFLVLFWGAAFPVIKVGLGYAPPVLFAGMRTLLCGAVVTLAALVWGGKANVGKNWRVYLLLAAFNVAGFMGLQTVAVLYMPSGTAAVVIYLQPILVGLLSYVMLNEPLPATKITGLLLGFSGIVAVSAGSFFASGSASGSLGAPVGVVFGAVSAVSWSLGTVYFKKYAADLPMLWAVALPFALGGLCLSILGLGIESYAAVSWTATYVACLLFTGLVGTALAWMLWLGLVRAGEASQVSAYVFFVPLISILIGALFLEESLSLSLAMGAALIVSGIYLVNR